MTSSADKPQDDPSQNGDEFDGWSRQRLVAEIGTLRAHLDGRLSQAQATGGELRTVSVPEPFTALFLNAQRYVERYFETFIHQPEQATISIAGERYILLRAASMSVEFVELVASLYQDRGADEARRVADNLLFDIAHALGRADALSFEQKMGVTDPLAKLSAGPIHFAFSGWAFVDILPESSPSPDEDFFLIYDHPFSFESHAWLTKGQRSTKPVCVMNAGYSSGWCEQSFGLPLVATEIECVACGGAHCRFIMAPPTRIESHLERYGYTGAHRQDAPGGTAREVEVPEFFHRRRLEDELRRANATLEERVRARTAELTRATEKLGLLARAVDNAVEGIVTMNAGREGTLTIRTVNQGFTQVSGIPERDAVGRKLDILQVVDSDRCRLQRVRDSVMAGEAMETEVNARRPDGTEYTLELHVMPGEAGGHSEHWIGLFRDVTRRHRHLAELRRQATYDALTDLPNRVLLFERLEEEVEYAMRTGGSAALMVIDLDGFKEINDTFGHHAGDILLEQVGPRVRHHVRQSDTVARLGGDEFAVLLPGVSTEASAIIQARAIVAALQEPFSVQSQELVVGASVGLVLCPDHGHDASTLLRRADVAMYVAKDGRRGVNVYRAEDDTYSPERLALVGELRTGIEQDQLIIHYQPQVNLATGAPRRVEALVRWEHPTLGLLLPEEFIPFIELGNLVERLTEWVLGRAMADCAAWLADGLDLGVSINIAPRSVRDPDFPQRIRQELERHALAPERLTLEVTETGLLIDPGLSLPIFEQLRALGVRLSIDDFGTGYSSFAHLRTLPVDEIKIDRTFVRDMMADPQDAAIVQSTIQLGRSIGRQVVAEGVETAAVLECLAELGCDYAQGYHIARPMTEARLREWLVAAVAL